MSASRLQLSGLTLSLLGLWTLPAHAQNMAPTQPAGTTVWTSSTPVEPPAVAPPVTTPDAAPSSPPAYAQAAPQVPLRPPATLYDTPPPPEQSPPSTTENDTNLPEPELPRKAPPSTATLSIGAGLVVWYHQPLLKGQKANVDTFYARLMIDGKKGIWGLHMEPRFRDTKQRSFEDGPIFLQEAYVSAAPGPFTIKIGKSYSKLGLFWDNSFYGNVQVYDGLKLAPDYGINVEGAHDLSRDFKLSWTLQYFIVDGRTNVSIPNRDIVSVPNARQRDNVIVRIDPELKLGGTNALRLGVSGQLFRADLAGANPTVLRGAVDAKFTYHGLGLWGEYLYQHGRHVTDYPITRVAATATSPAIAGRTSNQNHYALVGGEYTYGFLTARVNASYVNYSQVHVHETFVVPGVGFKPITELLLLAEYAHWRRSDDGHGSFIDRSLNITAQGFF